MKLKFSDKADQDLENIGDYIAKDSPRRAVTFIDELQLHCKRASEQPYAYPARGDLGPGLRMAVHGKYLILFRPEGNTVFIERIVHGARDLHNIL